ncbi:MAG: ATP-dependent helicase [Burkholderiales bacterium]|nr:ATP-dependent helicase [Burkholderiales bacterium]
MRWPGRTRWPPGARTAPNWRRSLRAPARSSTPRTRSCSRSTGTGSAACSGGPAAFVAESPTWSDRSRSAARRLALSPAGAYHVERSFDRCFVEDRTAGLNEQQRQVVAHDPARPLLVIAGAGTGKTNTLAHRLARFVSAGADPHRILLLTFSRRAAVELERRAGRVLVAALGQRSHEAIALPWAGTFHSAGARLLRMYAERIGLAPDFTIHDRGDTEDLMGLVRQGFAAEAAQRRYPAAATCAAIYSRAVNAERTLADVLHESYPRYVEWEAELKAMFGAYLDAKAAQHVLDFDDLLLYWSHMLADAELAREVSALFDYVLVDEFQDTNRLQGAILKRLRPDGRGVTVVGDDAQAIYAFRAADVRNILDFPGQYAPAADVLTLAVNYRSTQAILDASNAVMAQATERFTKDLKGTRGAGARAALVTVRDATDQARFVCEQVLAYREEGTPLEAQAVLFRSASHSAELELELARRNIPFVKYGGLKFLDAAHVKDVLALLRFAHNPRDRLAGFRAVRLVPGVGPATAVRVLDELEAAADPGAALRAAKLPAVAKDDWAALAAMCDAMRQPGSQWPSELDGVLAWYEPQLARMHDDAQARAADLTQLARIAATFASRERFLTEITLDPPAAAAGRADVPLLDDDYLVLSTIHSAKGQEWRSVHILNAVDGCIPSDMATGRREEIEEERRLLYVAMTRARDRLAIVVPQRFYVTQQARAGDRHVYAIRSRFLTPSVCATLEERTWPVPPASASAAASPGAAIDVTRRIREAWNSR